MLGYVILLSVALLFCLFRANPKNRALKSGKEGEKKVSSILRRHGFRVFDDVLFKINGKSVQIDHIAVSRHCLLIIETKAHRGLISGDPYEKEWRQVTSAGQIYTFYNPVWQNIGHQKTVEELLGTKNHLPIVVFASDPILNVGDSQMLVVTSHELTAILKMLKKERTFTKEEIKNICKKIISQNCNNKNEIKRHIESVKESAVI